MFSYNNLAPNSRYYDCGPHTYVFSALCNLVVVNALVAVAVAVCLLFRSYILWPLSIIIMLPYYLKLLKLFSNKWAENVTVTVTVRVKSPKV